MSKALPLMIQGTHSDVGKSVLVTAFCRIFTQDGYHTTPFKSQNMALNSYITIDGKEIGRAQGVQADAAGVIATTDMNPILIKPTGDNESQIVVHGKPYKNMSAGTYRKEFFDTGLRIIEEAITSLSGTYERMVIEGAGSPAEINLSDRELVNMRIARMANAPVILIGDIEKGGVFASLVGTLQLLSPEDRQRVIGVIINKFRGDVQLLQPGLTWFEEYTGKPVFGVVPHLSNLNIEAEDSVVLDRYPSSQHHTKDIDIAVIRYPRISNFTDIDPFFAEPDCNVRWITKAEQLGTPDLVILPGSKSTLQDLMFLKKSGIAEKLEWLNRRTKTMIFGICGGFQMLGLSVSDPHEMESSNHYETGLGFLRLRTTITQRKTTVLSQGTMNFAQCSIPVTGYEIHMGQSLFEGSFERLIQTKNHEEGCKSEDERVIGTYFHGIFHNDLFREMLLNRIRKQKGLDEIKGRVSFHQLRESAFDRLADHVREHVKLDQIHWKMNEFQIKGVPE
ncbi:cobyric acid synthase [Melghirimyces algeriensis]|uniref:Cobyric acid synthase n=1 Tax=Melghirimyces algeriensis TaxID=910412 RepID=A0A521F2N5_9BACL|nr:cobyric acid synthase [Melghirimyces algeriensis]SMO90444.1 adenosylcobyric acid synthase (glutamine-hydrolysing) [Melghirimyces algeriensis]